jgi:hypothetical protein
MPHSPLAPAGPLLILTMAILSCQNELTARLLPE